MRTAGRGGGGGGRQIAEKFRQQRHDVRAEAQTPAIISCAVVASHQESDEPHARVHRLSGGLLVESTSSVETVGQTAAHLVRPQRRGGNDGQSRTDGVPHPGRRGYRCRRRRGQDSHVHEQDGRGRPTMQQDELVQSVQKKLQGTR